MHRLVRGNLRLPTARDCSPTANAFSLHFVVNVAPPTNYVEGPNTVARFLPASRFTSMGSSMKVKGREASDSAQYPTVAISDLFNAAGHAYGAYLCRDANPTAALGLSFVAAAALAGVLRFGLHGPTFLPLNAAWAEVAGFVGLPLIGYQTLVRTVPQVSTLPVIARSPVGYLSAVLFYYAACREYTVGRPVARDNLKTLIALAAFVAPLLASAFNAGDTLLGGSVTLFVVAGLVIGADRHRCLLGVRRENWFHYAIGTAAVGIGLALSGRN
jgi:hypothetical protein